MCVYLQLSGGRGGACRGYLLFFFFFLLSSVRRGSAELHRERLRDKKNTGVGLHYLSSVCWLSPDFLCTPHSSSHSPYPQTLYTPPTSSRSPYPPLPPLYPAPQASTHGTGWQLKLSGNVTDSELKRKYWAVSLLGFFNR